jgi:FRG domain
MADFFDTEVQWVGTSRIGEGPNCFTVVNYEPRSPGFAQIVAVSLDDNRIGMCSDATMEITGNDVSGTTNNYRVFDRQQDRMIPLEEHFQRMGATEKPPTKATFTGKIEGDHLKGDYKNDLGEVGVFSVFKSIVEGLTGKQKPKSEIIGPLEWDEFKQIISKYRHFGKHIFRGQQSSRHPLRTVFHRARRNNLVKYVEEDFPRLRHRLNAISSHYYQASGEDFLALLALAQHHGFPTPLLDWTLSPYVAAFFAFDCLSTRDTWLSDREAVRIFVFDLNEWGKFPRIQAISLKDPWPDLQFVHPQAHNNPRYVPQQAIAAFSNVDDIEGFIAGYEVQHNVKCLTRIDIKADQRQIVEEDLRFMGITAAMLFPGVEGVCRAVRAECF